MDEVRLRIFGGFVKSFSDKALLLTPRKERAKTFTIKDAIACRQFIRNSFIIPPDDIKLVHLKYTL